jgi:hypothetical protein
MQSDIMRETNAAIFTKKSTATTTLIQHPYRRSKQQYLKAEYVSAIMITVMTT